MKNSRSKARRGSADFAGILVFLIFTVLPDFFWGILVSFYHSTIV
jgi:hypothetical protein